MEVSPPVSGQLLSVTATRKLLFFFRFQALRDSIEAVVSFFCPEVLSKCLAGTAFTGVPGLAWPGG